MNINKDTIKRFKDNGNTLRQTVYEINKLKNQFEYSLSSHEKIDLGKPSYILSIYEQFLLLKNGNIAAEKLIKLCKEFKNIDCDWITLSNYHYLTWYGILADDKIWEDCRNDIIKNCILYIINKSIYCDINALLITLNELFEILILMNNIIINIINVQISRKCKIVKKVIETIRYSK